MSARPWVRQDLAEGAPPDRDAPMPPCAVAAEVGGSLHAQSVSRTGQHVHGADHGVGRCRRAPPCDSIKAGQHAKREPCQPATRDCDGITASQHVKREPCQPATREPDSQRHQRAQHEPPQETDAPEHHPPPSACSAQETSCQRQSASVRLQAPKKTLATTQAVEQ